MEGGHGRTGQRTLVDRGFEHDAIFAVSEDMEFEPIQDMVLEPTLSSRGFSSYLFLRFKVVVIKRWSEGGFRYVMVIGLSWICIAKGLCHDRASNGCGERPWSMII